MESMYDNLPFVYETYNTTKIKKMYNRGSIMNDEERLCIHDWAIGLMSNSLMTELSNKHLKYKIDAIKNDPNVAQIVFEIRKRVEEREQLLSFEKDIHVNDFVEIVPTGGNIHRHCDQNYLERGLFHVRFNVFITLPKLGAVTYYDGHVIDSVEGSYVLCRSGIDEHWSDINDDVVPQISLSFGYLLPCEKVDDLCKDTNIGTYTQYYPLSINKPKQFTKIPITIEERGLPGSNIFTVADLFTSSQCDDIVDYITKNSALWSEKEVGNNSGNNVECKFLVVSDMVKSEIPDAKDIDNLIFKNINAVLTAFHETHPDFKGNRDSGYTLRKIYGGTKQHVDGVHSKVAGFTKFVRTLSVIIVLNDDYDGGIFNFLTQNLKFKLKKGEAVLFPPYWTHPHSVTSVGEGQARYTINTWILEDFIS